MSLCVNFSYAMYVIQSVAARELQPVKLSFEVVEMDRIPDVVHVVSSFGLVAGLLRNKKIPDELINSAGS